MILSKKRLSINANLQGWNGKKLRGIKKKKKASDILIVHIELRSLFITSLVAIMIIAKIIRYLFENIRLFFTQKISFRDQLVFASMILCLFTSVTRTNHLTMEKYSNESNLDNSKNQIVHSC